MNLNQIAAMAEALLSGEAHPNHALAKELAEELIKKAAEERAEEGRRFMQAQIDSMDDADLASFHRNND